MSTNPQSTKTPKWSVGSFLQQAVAGVESRLDTILAENDDHMPPADENKKESTTEQPNVFTGKLSAKSASATISRSSSSARKNDRLQERLARAMVKQSGSSSNVASNHSSPGVPSQAPSPRPSTEIRASVESPRSNLEILTRADGVSTLLSSPDVGNSSRRTSEDIPAGSGKVSGSEPRQSISSDRGTTLLDSSQDGYHKRLIPTIGVSAPPNEEETATEGASSRLQAEHDTAEVQWQEEMHGYIEKIDALQAKLKYLAKEAAESAKNAAATATPGSLEKKLFEKDERIAVLMEEGQKLSKTELEHRATIKKLRQYIAESTKSQTDAKRRIENIEKDLSKAEDRAQRFEQAEKRALSKLNAQAKTEKDLGNVTTERDNLRAEVADLNSRLNKAVARAEAAERRAQMGSSEAKSRRVAELKDDLASAKIEREISEEKLRREIRDLKEILERERERSRVQEMELRGELSVLEGKMETLRARAEEVSSSATGDAQAKLLRQIERLQTQYAVARENWNGIESSLVSRLANVEKERDEFARREGDLRRKVREANLKSKRIESEVENSHEAFQEMERDLEESRREVKKLSQKLLKAEADIFEAKQTFETERERQDAAWSQRLEEEKSKWHEQLSSSPPYLHPHSESPMTANRKSETLATMPDRPSSRRSPVLPLFPPGLNTPPRQSSYSSLNSSLGLRHLPHDNSSASLEISSVQVLEPEEYFTGAISPVTASAPETHQSKGINDIVSASTVAAGPSVQLVERMSATVRRLENERAAFKDELVCITNQRDEARQEVVALMKEVEEKRTCDKRIQDLEAAVRDLDERYQTTLEMLGEKSELVEEQKADIQDLKKIYRELVESTMK
ncbi:hypothetical protein D8B26_007395 [Coccidioides posadasii str. Silveira]|uniref:Uncharacterized protein n=1 Tax=Coccidioides posadasii (strain RMSCC 757 / Silveira) TaxID=443226 RepID=E9CUY9_COCPS|nr:conserved hypothetical protein [Coccidioides posadasii str. Silveira]QVM12778.1 hypothetical protein D8B26_007395 [Coccidioides posadasii str. Silveira]